MKNRLFIFGIDGVPYRQMEKYAEEGVMPNFRKLKDQGQLCKMKSSIPDISSVSWSTIISGKNPGEHGIFGFTDIIPGTYSMTFPNFATMKEKAYWQREDDKKHVIINVPSTYPAKPLNGYHVSGFVSLDLEKATFPGIFLGQLKALNYKIDVDSDLGHNENKEAFLRDLNQTLETRQKAAMELFDKTNWDTFFFVVTGSDRIGHFMMDAFENENHKYTKEFKDFYRKVDEVLGSFVDKLKPEDSIMMMSDHGMEVTKKNLNVNVLLQEKGFLEFEKKENRTFNDMKAESKAFALDPGRIYLHTAGRYPNGTVKEEEKEEIIKQLIDLFENLEYEGEKIIDKVYRKEEIYTGKETQNAPDLIIMAKRGYNLRGSITKEQIFDNDQFLIGKHTFDDSFFFVKTNKKITIPENFGVQDVLKIIDQTLEEKGDTMNCSNACNGKRTCWNCPAAILKGNVDFRACGQSKEKKKQINESQTVIECARRPELGFFEPTITFEQCPQWELNEEYNMYLLKNMKVMILGIDGYLGWSLALKLGKLGFEVSGVDNYLRRDCVMEKGSHTAVPIERMTERLHAAKEILGININFRKLDLNKERDKMKSFLEEVKPEAIVHYGEYPSAPYSMVDMEHALKVQDNNTLGTLGLLWMMKDICPEASMIKLGTMGEYGAPLTGRPLFEGLFPADAVLKWDNREWSLGGEITPRDPVSFYHVSKVQDAYNVYEACKYWWLRSYDINQGVIYGVHTEEVSKDSKLRTRFDIDEWYGTVINRFVAQAILGMPLTIYGEGQQLKGFIALDDAMQCMVRLISCPPEPGQYDVINQVSGLYKVAQLAEAVAKIGKEKFGLNVKIQRITNPRVETDNHPLEVLSTKLPNDFGFKINVTLQKEIENMFELLTKPEIKQRLEEKRHVILPVTKWTGEKEKPEILEEYEPGTKEDKGYQGKLIQ